MAPALPSDPESHLPTLRGLSSMATRAVLADLLATIAGRGGPAASIESVGGVDAARRVAAGESFDLVFLARGAIDRLIGQAHLLAPATDLFCSPVAVAVRSGAAQPGIDSAAAVREAVLDAATVGYSTGPSGVYLERLFDRWGLAPEWQERAVLAKPGVPVAELIVSGKAELGFQQLSELQGHAGIDVLGVLPPDCAFITTFSAAVGAQSPRASAAQELLRALTAPAAHEVIHRHGMTPATNASNPGDSA